MASNAEIHVIHTSINKNLRVKKYYLKKVGGVGREAGGGGMTGHRSRFIAKYCARPCKLVPRVFSYVNMAAAGTTVC